MTYKFTKSSSKAIELANNIAKDLGTQLCWNRAFAIWFGKKSKTELQARCCIVKMF